MITETITLQAAPAGYVDVPGIPYFSITEDGKVWNKRSNIQATISVQKNGYRTVALNWHGKTKTHYVHRLLAITHIPIPEHLKNVANLEVNHKDCDLSNNTKNNLEWVTPKQNIRHAYSKGRYGDKTILTTDDNSTIYSICVEIRNIRTNKVILFDTVTACADATGVNRHRLARHLESDRAGYVTKNWCVFRKFSKDPWPEIPNSHWIENRWDHPDGFWLAIKDNKIYTASKMPDLAKAFDIPLHLLQYNVKADGEHYFYKGIDFWYDDYPDKKTMEMAPVARKTVIKAAKRVLVTFVDTGDKEIFESMKAVARKLDCSDSSLIYAIQRKEGVYKNVILEWCE